jgi:hypothetical protein
LAQDELDIKTEKFIFAIRNQRMIAGDIPTEMIPYSKNLTGMIDIFNEITFQTSGILFHCQFLSSIHRAIPCFNTFFYNFLVAKF